jgi:hypothetical protein
MSKIHPVNSSFMTGIGYDATTRELTIRHKSGETYHYHNVGPAVHEALMEADSKGQFFNAHIKGNYRETRGEQQHRPHA